MTRPLRLEEVLRIHRTIIERTGGAKGIRDLGALQSSLAQATQSFGEVNRFETIIEKAAAYGFFIVRNHPFVDGNKRVAHASMETFLLFNEMEIDSDLNEQETLMRSLASGDTSLEELMVWLEDHTVDVKN